MANGTIRRLITDRGFGFIQTEEGKDLFFHRNELEEVDYNSLTEGQQVEYEIGRGRDGRLQAVKVRLAEPVAEVSAEVMPAVELEEKPAEPAAEVSAEITPAAELEEKPAKPAARRRARAAPSPEPTPEPKVEKLEEAPAEPEGE